MKTPIFYILSVLFLASSFSNASSFLGKAPESGIIISVNPEKIPSKSGESVLISGTIKYVKKSQSKPKDDVPNGSDKKHGLLEDFKAQGIDIVGAFPSSAVDISSELTLESVSDHEIRFSYQSKSIVADDLNQFTLKVYNNHTNKGALKKLSVIQAKLERRLQLLANLKKKFESGKATQDAIAAIEKEIAKLSAITVKIAKKLNTNENLMAENSYAIQVDNLTSNYSKLSTVMNDFRFMVNSDIGSVIQGMKINLKSQIVSLSQTHESSDDSVDDDDGYLAECYFNDQKISSQKIIEPRKNVDVVFDYPTEKLNPANANIFSMALYRLEDGVKGRRIGYLNYKVPVIADSVKPIWLSEAIPNHQDRYVQNLRPISLKAQDSFGRVDPATFKLLLNSQSMTKDLSQSISSTKFDDGAMYEFTGDLNPLDEGEYTLTAKISDLATNAADDFNVIFRIDRTAPVISTTLATNTLTNKTSIEVPITVSDLSPTATDVYVNNELVLTTAFKEFSASATLAIEGKNTIRIESKDAAGNIALTHEVVVVRDTTPPVLSNLLPQNNSTINTIQFIVSAQANEKLKYVKVNGMPSPLAADKLSFGMTYTAQDDGELNINIECSDEAGNIAHQSAAVLIKSRLLNVDLIHIGLSFNRQRLMVTGLEEATRAGSRVEISSGFLRFNSGETISNASNGSFNIEMDYFTQATISVTDMASGETEQATLIFDKTKTKLSGIIKDSNNNPLPNVTVKVTGSVSSYLTDGTGMFTINNPPTGDQTLLVDGSTVPQSITGPNRRFFANSVSINVGIGQNNVMDNPIYLTPLYMDGTQTQVNQNATTVVTSVHAPGVELTISPNTAIFPDGSETESINIVRLESAFSTVSVPEVAVPTHIYSLEPSGLKFKKRVELKLPNDNDLPPGVEFLIYSMNSSSGNWEIDGSAAVSSDGSSVVTKPGLGISHFSNVYAVPISPLIHEVKGPNLLGIDASAGSLTRTVSLPSFKSLGQDIKPTLTYKSNWANPTAVGSNIIDIPIMKTDIRGSFTNDKFEIKSIEKMFCFTTAENQSTCEKKPVDYLLHSRNTFSGTISSWYEPEEIKAQFFIGGQAVESPNYIIDDEASSNLGNSKFGSGVYSKVSTIGANNQNVKVPRMSQIGYSLELIDKNTGQYFSSGIYPSMARYQIKLKNISLLTGTNITRNTVNGKGARTIRTVFDNRRESQVLEQAIPKDLHGSVLVQSKVLSQYGRGWKLNGIEKVLNTTGSRILLENGDGSVATYALNNTIHTVYNANDTGIDLNRGVNLASWPNILLNREVNNEETIVRLNLSSQTPQLTNIGNVITNSGVVGTEGLDQCRQQIPVPPPRVTPYGTFSCANTFYASCDVAFEQLRNPTYMPVQYDYTVNPTLAGIVELSNGKIVGLDSRNHSVFRFESGGFSKIAGNVTGVHNSIKSNAGMWRLDMNEAETSTFCSNFFGRPCTFKKYESEYTVYCAARSSSINKNGFSIYTGDWKYCPGENMLQEHGYTYRTAPREFGRCTNAGGYNGFPPEHQIPLGTFSGVVGIKGFSGQEIQSFAGSPDSIGLNSPKGIVEDIDGNVLFVDSGNNRVRKINFSTNQIITIAGNGATTDAGDGGLAINSSLFHPKEVAVDGLGQIYITTENGYVRKIDTNGVITTFAGLPLTNGGLLTDDIHAESMALNNPTGMVIDKDNSYLYVADTGNHRVVKIDLATKMTTTIAGSGSCDLANAGDNKAALVASLCSPTYLGLDSVNNLVVVDAGHKLIRKVILQAGGSELTFLSSSDTSQLKKLSNSTWMRLQRDGSTTYYNSNGDQVRSVDRSGLAVNFEYDGANNLIKIKNEATSQETLLSYSDNKLMALRDPAQRVTSFSYDGDELKQVSLPDGSTRKFSYNDRGMMMSDFDGMDNEVKFEYDNQNRPSKVINPNGTVSYLASQESATAEATDAGTLKSAGTSTNSLNSQGTPAGGATVKYSKDYNGFVTTMVNQQGVETELVRDLNGRVIRTTDSDGRIVEFEYNSFGDLTKTRDVTNQIETSTAFDSFGLPVSATNTRGFTSSKTYSSTGLLLIESVSGTGSVTVYEYEARGLVENLNRKVNNQFLTTHLVYDERGNPTEITDANGKLISNLYDKAGNLVKQTAVISGTQTAVTEYEFDLMNRLTKVTAASGDVTQYNYYANGLLSEVVDDKNKNKSAPAKTSFYYNNMNQLVKKELSTGEIYTYNYDPEGKWITQVDPNGISVRQEFNVLNQLVKIILPDDVFIYEYDSKGKVKSAENKNSRIIYERDWESRITKSSFSGLSQFSQISSLVLDYQYDKVGNKVRTVANNNITFGYNFDEANRITKVTSSLGDEFEYEYDSADRLNRFTRPNGETIYSYFDNGMLSALTHTSNGSTIESFGFSYDSRNFIVQKRSLASIENYSYSKNGQLEQNSSGDLSETFNYDSIGNRLSDQAGVYSYNSTNYRLDEDYRFTYLYDNVGNLVAKNPKDNTKKAYRYEYTSYNQLKKVVILSNPFGSAEMQIDYEYDVLGRRLQKSVTNLINPTESKASLFEYDDQNMLFEFYKSSNSPNFSVVGMYTYSQNVDDILSIFIPASSSSEKAKQSGKYYFLKDKNGSIISIVDANGNKKQNYSYSAFGTIRKIVDGIGVDITSDPFIKNQFTFTGREFDEELGLYYYRARYYDASIGRFLQKDPDAGRLIDPQTVVNQYSYVQNRPTMLVDPSGMFSLPSLSDVGDAFSGFFGSVGDGFGSAIKDFFDTFLNGMLEIYKSDTYQLIVMVVLTSYANPLAGVSAFFGTMLDSARTGDWSAGAMKKSWAKNYVVAFAFQGLFAGLDLGTFNGAVTNWSVLKAFGAANLGDLGMAYLWPPVKHELDKVWDNITHAKFDRDTIEVIGLILIISKPFPTPR